MIKRALLFHCLAAALLTLVFSISASGATPKIKTGAPLPDWREGVMDLHFINSGSGECLFCIFPDGTTMLIDAGETVVKDSDGGLRPAWKIYSDYIGHFMQATGSSKIDYALLTHFHIDHFGDAHCSVSQDNGYAHMGMTALYDKIPYGKIVDRGYPLYRADSTIYLRTPEMKGNTSGCVDDWINFVSYAAGQGCAAERFSLGSDKQFTLCRGGWGKYDFKVLNVVSNGQCISRKDDGGIEILGAKVESENAASCGVQISYGDFDFLACGDLTGAPQNVFAKGYLDTFKPSIELFKANHHLHHNAWGTGMTEVGFKPDATISFSWCKTDPKHFPVAMIEKVSALTDLYATSPKSAYEFPDAYAKLKDYGGHFVVRVSKDGSFWICKLDDNNAVFTVKAVHGPYRSR